jgi:D-lactate dehydrogenase (cytochrome)
MEFKPVLPGCGNYLHDESRMEGTADYIAFPEDTIQAAEAIRKAAKAGLPVTVQGARTGIVGGAVPAGGLILSTERMNRTMGSGTSDSGRQALRVQAGIPFAELNSFLIREMPGYRFTPNPTEPSASLGGAFACNARGPNSLRNGGTGAHVHALTWITPCGEIWDIPRGRYQFDAEGCPLPNGSRLNSNVSIPSGACTFLHPTVGIDLVDFLAGSEGLVGIAGELSLCLERRPAVSWAVVYFFRAEDRAAGFAQALSRWKENSSGGAYLSSAEYYDNASLELVRQGSRRVSNLRHLPFIGSEYREALHVELEGDNPDEIESALMEQLAL